MRNVTLIVTLALTAGSLLAQESTEPPSADGTSSEAISSEETPVEKPVVSPGRSPIYFPRTRPQPEVGTQNSITIHPASHTVEKPIPKSESVTDNVQHLLKAADHLEAAGLDDQAEVLRKQAQELQLKLSYSAKINLLKRLEAEVAAIQRQLDSSHTSEIQLNFHLVEIKGEHLAKLGVGKKGIELVDLLPGKTQIVRPRQPGEPKPVMQLWAEVVEPVLVDQMLDLLKNAKMVKVHSSPSLITTPGRTANLFSGGQIPIPTPQSNGTVSIEYKEIGIGVQVTPLVLPEGTVQLELMTKLSQVDPENSVSIDDQVVPGILTKTVNANLKMPFGQTAIIGGFEWKGEPQFILVTPRRIEKPFPLPTAPASRITTKPREKTTN